MKRQHSCSLFFLCGVKLILLCSGDSTGPTDPISPSSSPTARRSITCERRGIVVSDGETHFCEFGPSLIAGVLSLCWLLLICYCKYCERDSPGGGELDTGSQLGERDQDWEVLESLFASSTGGNNSSSFGDNDVNVDHDIAASVATIFNSENGGNRRRKRERGLRLVRLLKETSLKVEMSQLIPKEGIVVVGGDDDGSQGGGTKKEEEEGECGVDLNSNNIEDDSNNGDIELASIDNMTRAADVQEGGVDDDNKYTALCLPCSSSDKDTTTSSNSVEATASSPLSLAQSAPPQSAMQDDTQRPSSRLVPPTCAICLVSYSPGCYVTWSSNPDCIHAFHRDCILMWLLKKEEPLCPCCRREFVSSSRWRIP